MANKYTKKCSTSLAKKEMQVKTQRFYLIPVRLAIIKKTTTKNAVEDARKKTLIHCWW
jgi:hypothetical protein